MKDSTSLARLTEEGLRIQAIMELEALDPETLQKELDSIDAKWLTKVENIGHLIKDSESVDRDLEEEINRLKSRRETLKTRVEWLKGYTLQNMLSKAEPKLQFSLVTVAVATNPPSVEIVDEKAIPSCYQKVVMEIHIDKRGIIEHFKKSGEIVSGCKVITDRKRLVIR